MSNVPAIRSSFPHSALAALLLSALASWAQTGGTWSVLPKSQVPASPPQYRFNMPVFVSDTSGIIHMTDGDRLFRNTQGVTSEIPVPRKPNHLIEGLVADPAGPLWILTATPPPRDFKDPDQQYALIRLAQGQPDTIPLSPCADVNYIQLLGEDGKGNAILHVGHNTRSMAGLSNSRIFRFNRNECKEITLPPLGNGPPFISEGYVRDRSGAEYLFGNRIGGDIIYGTFAFRVGAVPTLLVSPDGPDRIRSLHAMKDQMLAQLGIGIGTVRGNGIQDIIDTVLGKPIGGVFDIFQDSRGDIWMPTESWDGTSQRIRVLQIHGRDTVPHFPPTAPNDRVRTTVEDDRGNLWFLLTSGDLLLWTRTGNQVPLALGPYRPARIPKTGSGLGAIGHRDFLGRSLRGSESMKNFHPRVIWNQ